MVILEQQKPWKSPCPETRGEPDTWTEPQKVNVAKGMFTRYDVRPSGSAAAPLPVRLAGLCCHVEHIRRPMFFATQFPKAFSGNSKRTFSRFFRNSENMMILASS